MSARGHIQLRLHSGGHFSERHRPENHVVSSQEDINGDVFLKPLSISKAQRSSKFASSGGRSSTCGDSRKRTRDSHSEERASLKRREKSVPEKPERARERSKLALGGPGLYSRGLQGQNGFSEGCKPNKQTSKKLSISQQKPYVVHRPEIFTILPCKKQFAQP